MRTLFLALAFVCLPARVQAEQPDAFGLQIDVGRLGVMMDIVREMMFAPERPVPTQEEDPSARIALARSLRITVLEYNALALQLCAEGRFTAMTCRRAWLPAWVSEAHDARPSLATIAWRQRAVEDQITPLWDAICDEARAKVPEYDRITVCPME